MSVFFIHVESLRSDSCVTHDHILGSYQEPAAAVCVNDYKKSDTLLIMLCKKYLKLFIKTSIFPSYTLSPVHMHFSLGVFKP